MRPLASPLQLLLWAFLAVADDHNASVSSMCLSFCSDPQIDQTSTPTLKTPETNRCNQRFDLRNLRALMQRHYCGRCQRAFCLPHTAFSTHGPRGQCGAESGCLCFACYREFTAAYRSALSARNTLADRQRTLSGPPGGGGRPRRSSNGNGTGGGSAAEAEAPGASTWQLQQGGALSRPQSLPSVAAALQHPEPEQQRQQRRQQQQQEAGAPPSRGRALWRRGWVKLSAVGRLQRAGSSVRQGSRELAPLDAGAPPAPEGESPIATTN
jgi:hypothetical protein